MVGSFAVGQSRADEDWKERELRKWQRGSRKEKCRDQRLPRT